MIKFCLHFFLLIGFVFPCANTEEIVMILESLDEENACYEFYSLLVTEISFSTDRHFFGLHCEQLETDIENLPHGFFPESDGF